MTGSLVGIKWGEGGKFSKGRSVGYTKLDVLKTGTEHLEQDLLQQFLSGAKVLKESRGGGGGGGGVQIPRNQHH